MMKKQAMKVGAAVLSLAMLAGVGAGCSWTGETDAVSYVSVDVNPEISLTLDKRGEVLSVVADNEDAQVLLYEEDLVGMSAEDALEKIAELCVEYDFLNEANAGVSVTVAGKADEEEIVASAQAAFEAAAGEHEVYVSSDATFSLERQLRAAKAEYTSSAAVQGMDLVKFRLVLEAQRVDGSLTLTAAAEMDASELIAKIEEGAQKIRPYATAAYNAAVAAAEIAYAEATDVVLDAIWVVPYINFVDYPVNYGLIYNVYRNSARVLATGLAAADAAAEIAARIEVPESVTDEAARVLGMTEEEKAAFLAEAAEDGKITLASLEDWLDRHFKEMTEEERAAVREEMNDILEAVTEFAIEVDASIADEYKAALAKLCEDISDLIPDAIKDVANAYIQELDALIGDLREASEGKQGREALVAAQEVFTARSEEVMKTMREDLSEEDLAAVEKSIEKVQSTLESAKEKMEKAIADAEQAAREYLEACRAARAGTEA